VPGGLIEDADVFDPGASLGVINLPRIEQAFGKGEGGPAA